MDKKEMNNHNHDRKNRFDQQLRVKAREQLKQNNEELNKNNIRKSIKSLQDVCRRDRSGNKNLPNFQGNGEKFNAWGNDRAINKVLKRKDKQVINENL